MLWIIITLQHILLLSGAFNACVWFHTVATQTHLPNENWTLPQGKLDSSLLTRDQLCPHSGPTDRAKSKVFFLDVLLSPTIMFLFILLDCPDCLWLYYYLHQFTLDMEFTFSRSYYNSWILNSTISSVCEEKEKK